MVGSSQKPAGQRAAMHGPDKSADAFANKMQPCDSFGGTPFSFEERRAIGEMLCIAPDRNDVSSRPGYSGKRVYYLEGWKVISEANRVFGFSGWSQTVLDTTLHSVEQLGNGRHAVCATALVRITLKNGATREDRGGGNSNGFLSKGEAIIAAEKEAITDATKRALRTFGPHFGLSLYDKDFLQYLGSRDKQPKPNSDISAPVNKAGEKRSRDSSNKEEPNGSSRRRDDVIREEFGSQAMRELKDAF